MGPWYNDATRTTAFVNLPLNHNENYRIPRTPVGPGDKEQTSKATSAISSMASTFDPTDATSYSHASGTDGDPPGMPGGVIGDGSGTATPTSTKPSPSTPRSPTSRTPACITTTRTPSRRATCSATTSPSTPDEALPREHRRAGPSFTHRRVGERRLPDLRAVRLREPATSASSGVRRMVSGYVPRDGWNGTAEPRHRRPPLPAGLGGARTGRTASWRSTKYGPDVSTVSRWAVTSRITITSATSAKRKAWIST